MGRLAPADVHSFTKRSINVGVKVAPKASILNELLGASITLHLRNQQGNAINQGI